MQSKNKFLLFIIKKQNLKCSALEDYLFIYLLILFLSLVIQGMTNRKKRKGRNKREILKKEYKSNEKDHFGPWRPGFEGNFKEKF